MTTTTGKGAIALEGGAKVWNEAFPMWPSFEESTIQKAMEPLRSGKVNYWTGPVGKKFEDAWAKWMGIGNAISVCNGTAALHVALASMGIGAGDEVICPSYSFIAPHFVFSKLGRFQFLPTLAKIT
ncbi:MAG: DegT/DnrJ/EryC1/StrS family aminotransferase [Victivallaceae bacterium]|nr:DegT/DnrJ/EryC1/StrS family aminotransferase [Victivallaceae bacterium]